MKTSKHNFHCWMLSVLGSALIFLGSGTLAWGTESVEVGIRPLNNYQGAELVAPYGHFASSGGGAPGPWSTVYLITEVSGVARTVNVKCYNDSLAPVGPAAGTTVPLTAFNMQFYTPEALGITTHAAFTGFGWCYFAVGAGDPVFDAGVTVGVGTGMRGIAGNPTIFGSDNSRAIAMDTAQHMVTTSSGDIPFWTKQVSWKTYLLSLNPTTTSRTLTVNVYNDAGTYTGAHVTPLNSRDLDLREISALGGAATFGSADVTVSGRGFVGWVAGFNSASSELFLYPVPLSRNYTSELVAGDRP